MGLTLQGRDSTPSVAGARADVGLRIRNWRGRKPAVRNAGRLDLTACRHEFVVGQSVSPREGSMESPPGQPQRNRVLVVDDEATIRHILLNVLEENDCETREAGSAEEALALLPGFIPAVALLD